MLTRRITGSIIIFLYLLAACATESDIDSTIATSVAATLEAAGSTAVTSSSSNPTATLEESTSVTQSTNILEPTIAVEPTVTVELPPTPRLVWSLTADRAVVLVDVEKAVIQSNEAIQVVNINNGEVLWSVTGSSPLLGADSDLVYTLPFSQRVDALDIGTGEPVWSSQLPSQLQTSSRSV